MYMYTDQCNLQELALGGTGYPQHVIDIISIDIMSVRSLWENLAIAWSICLVNMKRSEILP